MCRVTGWVQTEPNFVTSGHVTPLIHPIHIE
jgi:hypothetical protein